MLWLGRIRCLITVLNIVCQEKLRRQNTYIWFYNTVHVALESWPTNQVWQGKTFAMDNLYKKFNDEYRQSCVYNRNVTFNFETGTHLSPCFVLSCLNLTSIGAQNLLTFFFKGISCKGRRKINVMNT